MIKRLILIGLLLTAPTKVEAQIIGGPPHECPKVAFCGCALAKRVFGSAKRELWLAANWFRFRRTNPAPHMVAVRRHHVMQLINHIRGSQWVVWDPNSGGHKTRVHIRSIVGYTIVDPRG